jgi:hypothetical protein
MNKFKVGDPVRIHDEDGREKYDGKVGTITEILEMATYPYVVKFPKGDDELFKESELELIQ